MTGCIEAAEHVMVAAEEQVTVLLLSGIAHLKAADDLLENENGGMEAKLE